MDKSTHFFGTSVFGQLISLIDPKIISKSTQRHKSDRYIKKFKTKDHLISMLFCSLAKCASLREVSGAMLGLSGKTKHFQLNHIPKRSTPVLCNGSPTFYIFISSSWVCFAVGLRIFVFTRCDFGKT